MIRLFLLLVLMFSAPPAWGQTSLAPGTYTVPPGTTIVVPAPELPPVTQYMLTITMAGTGAGTVTGAGAYPAGTLVTPGASPAADSRFDGWSLPIPIPMDADKTVTATFTLIPPPPPPPTGLLDESRLVGAPDGQGGYLTVRLRGSSYTGQAGTDLVVGTMTALGAITDRVTLTLPDTQDGAVLVPGPPGMFLLAWQDLRNGSDYDVYGARVRADGTLLDPGGFLIAGGVHNQMSPAAAWDGMAWTVAFASFDGVRYEIRSAVVSLAGAVTPTMLVSRNETQHSVRPHVVATQTGLWIFWAEARSRNRLMAKQLATGETFQVTPSALAWLNSPTVMATDGRYVLLAGALAQEKAYSTRDIVGVIWDTHVKALVQLDPMTTTIFRQVGTGAIPGVLWIKEGTNYASTSTFDGAVREWSAMYDGTDFRLTWSTIHMAGGDSWGPVKAFRISTRRIAPATGSYYGAPTRELLSGPTPVWSPIIVDSGSQLRLFYDIETADGLRTIQSLEMTP